MSVIIDSEELSAGISKVLNVISDANILNFYFGNNNIKIKTVINQYQMEYNIPTECSEELKFSIPAKSFLSILSGKNKVTLELDGTTLKFKSGRSKGTLVVMDYEDHDIVIDDGEALDSAIKNYIFNNLERLNFSGKNVNKSLALDAVISNNKIKMLCMDPYYSGLLIDSIDISDEVSFKILLKYANTIINTFSKDEDIIVTTSSSSVGIKSDRCKIILPRIAEQESLTIEEAEKIIESNTSPENLEGAIIVKDSKSLLKDIDELRNFIQDSPGSKLQIIGKDDKVKLTVIAQIGKLDKILTDAKLKGEFIAQFNIEDFRTCLEKNTTDAVKISFYSTFCTIKSNASKESIYLVAETK